jgi:hypothetical protein
MIYFIQSGDTVKIGNATNPAKRIRQLKTGNPNSISMLGVMEGTHEDEFRIHGLFVEYRIDGEWFVLSDAIISFIERNCRPYIIKKTTNGAVRKETDSMGKAIDFMFFEPTAQVLSLQALLFFGMFVFSCDYRAFIYGENIHAHTAFETFSAVAVLFQLFFLGCYSIFFWLKDILFVRKLNSMIRCVAFSNARR